MVDAREVTGGDHGVDAGEAAGGEHRADADVVAGRDLGLATRMDLGLGGLDLGGGDAALGAVVACRIALALPCRKRRPLGRRRVARFSPEKDERRVRSDNITNRSMNGSDEGVR